MNNFLKSMDETENNPYVSPQININPYAYNPGAANAVSQNSQPIIQPQPVVQPQQTYNQTQPYTQQYQCPQPPIQPNMQPQMDNNMVQMQPQPQAQADNIQPQPQQPVTPPLVQTPVNPPVQTQPAVQPQISTRKNENNMYEKYIEKNIAGLTSEQMEEIMNAAKDVVLDNMGNDLKAFGNTDETREKMYKLVDRYLQNESRIRTMSDRKEAVEYILNDIIGLGVIEPLMNDDSITEIMVSRYDKIYIEIKGEMVRTGLNFKSDEQLDNVIKRIISPLNRQFNARNSLVDARLADGSRVNATCAPSTPDGCTLTIRKFPKHRLTIDDYLRFGSMDERTYNMLECFVRARCNMLISGGTGTGKTTLLNALSNAIPSYESIVTIEDSLELQLNQENVRRMEAKQANAEGEGAVTIRDLVKNAKRMRPDRIVVDECRDEAVVDMLNAMTSGHDGSLTTAHADSPYSMVNSTIPIMFGMSDMNFSENAMRQLIASGIDIIVQIKRYRDHSRKIERITHVVGYGRQGANILGVKEPEENKIYLKDIMVFKETGVDEKGKIIGKYMFTGYEPKEIINKLKMSGIPVTPEMFRKTEEPLKGDK